VRREVGRRKEEGAKRLKKRRKRRKRSFDNTD